jgi:hypothetical protein
MIGMESNRDYSLIFVGVVIPLCVILTAGGNFFRIFKKVIKLLSEK